MIPTTVQHPEDNSSLGNHADNEEPCNFSLGRNDIVVDEVDKKGEIKKNQDQKIESSVIEIKGDNLYVAAPEVPDTNKASKDEKVETKHKAKESRNVRRKKSSSKLCTVRKFASCCACMCSPILFIGYVLFVLLLFASTMVTTQMLIFVLIDVVRTLVDTLRILIFIFSVVAYVTRICMKFNDKYRQLKNTTIRIILEKRNLGKMILKGEKIYSEYPVLLWEDGEIGMYKKVLDAVVAEMLPYRKSLLKVLLRIVATFLLATLFFWIIIDFQVS